jgi:hypothetical protein
MDDPIKHLEANGLENQCIKLKGFLIFGVPSILASREIMMKKSPSLDNPVNHLIGGLSTEAIFESCYQRRFWS